MDVIFDNYNSIGDTLFFEVKSESRPELLFDVWIDKQNMWLCTCENYYYRKVFCKHMRAVRNYFERELMDKFSDFNKVMYSDITYNEIQQNFYNGDKYGYE